MSTQLSSDQKQKINNPWDDLLKFKNEDEEIEHEAQMLMYSFLSEVERYQDLQGVNKKSLAEKIKTSASYITQLFRGNKPLNFNTIARIQKVLKVRFQVNAIPIAESTMSLDVVNMTKTYTVQFDNFRDPKQTPFYVIKREKNNNVDANKIGA